MRMSLWALIIMLVSLDKPAGTSPQFLDPNLAAVQPDTSAYHVYLTFDDGPVEASANILRIITARHAKVNVFLVGKRVFASDSSKKLFAKYLASPLVEAGNHGYSHANSHYRKYYKQPDSVLFDFERNKRLLGLKSNIARMPGRNTWRLPGLRVNDAYGGSSAADSLYKHGYLLFGWDIEWKYSQATDSSTRVQKFLEEVKRKLQKGQTRQKGKIIILAHDDEFRQHPDIADLQQLLRAIQLDRGLHLDHLRNY